MDEDVLRMKEAPNVGDWLMESKSQERESAAFTLSFPCGIVSLSRLTQEANGSVKGDAHESVPGSL
jgi:hypothetical protein